MSKLSEQLEGIRDSICAQIPGRVPGDVKTLVEALEIVVNMENTARQYID